MSNFRKGTIIVHFKNGNTITCAEAMFLNYSLASRAHDRNEQVVIDGKHNGKPQKLSFPARNVLYLEWRDD